MPNWMYPAFEKMEIVVPETLELKASGVTIGEMHKFGDNPDLYVIANITQKFDLLTFITMINEYWGSNNRKVKHMIVNFDDSDILIYLEKEEGTPRG